MKKDLETIQAEMSVRDAAFHTAHDYPGGCTPLAVRMGVNPQTLAHKVTPNDQNRYALNLQEAVRMQLIASDFRILNAMARELGFAVVQLSPHDAESLNGCMASAVREFGDFLKTISDSIADEQVTDSELSLIDSALGKVMGQANALRAQLAEMNSKLHKQGPIRQLEKLKGVRA